MHTGGLDNVLLPYIDCVPSSYHHYWCVEEEAHCYVVQCRRIVCGQYVADYSTAECRTFRSKGLRQLHTKRPIGVVYCCSRRSSDISQNTNASSYSICTVIEECALRADGVNTPIYGVPFPLL